MAARFGVDDRVAQRIAFREIIKEEARQYRGYVPSTPRTLLPEQEPEFASIRAFVAYMQDEADDNGKIPPYTVEQVEKLSYRLRMNNREVALALNGAGLTPATREPSKEPRGYKSTSNKWAENPSYGGSGQVEITGFANSAHSGRAPELGMTRRHTSRFPVHSAKPQGLSQVDPEKDRARLQMIKQAEEVRRETELQKMRERAVMETAARNKLRKERLLLRLMVEAESILKCNGTVTERMDKCIRFMHIIDLFKSTHGESSVAPIQSDIDAVKAVFTSLL